MSNLLGIEDKSFRFKKLWHEDVREVYLNRDAKQVPSRKNNLLFTLVDSLPHQILLLLFRAAQDKFGKGKIKSEP
jgi:hypothetical protein